jgi:hypothetical protein
MTPEQLAIFLDDNRKSTAEAIRTTVNGKIDTMHTELAAHNTKDDERWERMEPVVMAIRDAKAAGKASLWVAGFIMAVSGAYHVVKITFFE